MSLVKAAIHAFEDTPMPDVVSRAAIHFLVGDARRRLAGAPADASASFARTMGEHPIAAHTDAANAQHYELPAAFFEVVLGPQPEIFQRPLSGGGPHPGRGRGRRPARDRTAR